MANLRNLRSDETAALFKRSQQAKQVRKLARKRDAESRVRMRAQRLKRLARQAADIERVIPVEGPRERQFERYARDLASMGWYLCESSAWSREDRLGRGSPWPLTLGWCLATAGMLAWRRP